LLLSGMPSPSGEQVSKHGDQLATPNLGWKRVVGADVWHPLEELHLVAGDDACYLDIWQEILEELQPNGTPLLVNSPFSIRSICIIFRRPGKHDGAASQAAQETLAAAKVALRSALDLSCIVVIREVRLLLLLFSTLVTIGGVLCSTGEINGVQVVVEKGKIGGLAYHCRA